MRRRLGAVLVGGVVSIFAGDARAQMPSAPATQYRGPYTAYGAPGYYGMAYGVPSFGVPRTYSEFSSSYGAGYGYGYGPSTLESSRYGVGLWRPGLATPGYVFGAASYRTFPVPYRPAERRPSPPVGMYAPGFGPAPVGPPGYYAW